MLLPQTYNYEIKTVTEQTKTLVKEIIPSKQEQFIQSIILGENQGTCEFQSF
jgi:hypothetical protein